MMNWRFSASSGLGSWSGNSPSGVPVGLDQLERQALEQRADHRAGHAVAAVDDDLHRLDVRRVDERQRGLVELRRRCRPPRRAAAAAGRRGRPASTRSRGCRRCRGRRTARSRRARRAWPRCRPSGCATRCTSARRRGRASRRGNRASRCRPCPASTTSAPSADDALAVARRELGRGEAHVAAEADAQLVGGLARQVAQDAGEGAADLLGDVAVDLVAVEAADVIRLEDAEVDCHRSAAS